MSDDIKKPGLKDESSKIPVIEPRGDFEMNTNHHDSSKVMTIATCVILAVAVIGGVIAIAPEVKSIASQKQQIKDLKAQLAEAKTKGEDSSAVQMQLSDVQKKMQALADQAQNIPVNTDVQNKLAELENKFGQVVDESHKLGIAGMMARVQAMQQSPEGAAIVSSLVNMLAATPDGSDIGQTFQSIRKTDPGVAEITEGVAPEDMKAAAMLIALSQMRGALMRGNDSFDNDLALLKKTLPDDDPALLEAIDRLAPQAKYGVLSSEGLSDEFRGMATDIVSASMSGPDVKVKDKVKARLANVFIVEKNGKRVSGTETQIAISAAQQKLDQGDVQGAVEILQTLQGPAAQKTQPFITQAQATMTAQGLVNQIGQNVAQNVRAGVKTMMNGGMPHGVVNPYGVNGITGSIQSLLPDGSPSLTPKTGPLPTAAPR